jgi:nitronate monooxygenase
MSVLAALALPIVQAPMAGGPSTPELAGAVSGAGGLGFLAAGYRTAAGLGDDVAATRALTDAPFGVNVFAPTGAAADGTVVRAYMEALRGEVEAAGVELGTPRFDDDAFDDKISLLVGDPVAVVSFTFGAPGRAVVERLQAAGSEVWGTVTTPAEAVAAAATGVDALIVQGAEAGGHRGAFADLPEPVDYGLLALLALVQAAAPGMPLVASGGIATGAGVGAALVAGAAAAQLGTAYLRTPEAGTAPSHREALLTDRPTAVTRAYSGRRGRGIVNRVMTEHDTHAPSAYPEIHHITSPLRAHGRRTDDADLFNLWAGEAHALTQDRPAAELTRALAAEAREAVAAVAARFSAGG